MLRFISLSVENFGPFKGLQTMKFSENNGVTIIWGNNGRGKTTLLNVFRYALFGSIKARTGDVKEKSAYCNKESIEEGIYGFKVTLRMTSDDNFYDLTRQYVPRTGISVPRTEDDYEESVFLKENGAILSPDHRDHVLNKIMPSEVARFFLFDGELLQEYEDLLMDDSRTGAEIKKAIEKILGLPILTNAASDILGILNDLKSEVIQAAQKDQKTQAIATKLATNTEKQDKLQEDYDRLRRELEAETVNDFKTVDQLKQTEHIRHLLSQEKIIDNEILLMIKQKEDYQTLLKSQISLSWGSLLENCVRSVISSIRSRRDELSELKDRELASSFLYDELVKSVSNEQCSVCEQDIDNNVLTRLQEKIAQYKDDNFGMTAMQKLELKSLDERLKVLESVDYPDQTDLISETEKKIRNITVKLNDASAKLSNVKDEISKYGEIKGVEELADRHIQSQQLIKNYRDGIDKTKKELEEVRDSINRMDEILRSSSTDLSLQKATRKVDEATLIQNVFQKGIGIYRDKLKKDVERDATDIFVRISSEKDYSGLEINDNYGLSVIRNTGDKVPFRSAGYEHIVALSLIGALHKNAPLRGPIIMDSPFGRLDPDHKRNTTEALPTLSDQVVLLLYRSEINEQDTRQILGNKLLKEYQLTRRSSFNTQIELIGG